MPATQVNNSDSLQNQIDALKTDYVNSKVVEQQTAEPEKLWWSNKDAMTISATVLTFGFVLCLLAAYLLSKGRSADSILKTLGTILIIVAALFLVVAGYSDRQIAPVMGLLGTIAGYLLGKDAAKPKPDEKPAP
jgi:hypothetical protein